MAKVDNETHFVGMIAQKAFIENDKGEILLVQYPDDDIKSAAGTWDLPGGRLNVDEDSIAGLKREVLEETGAEIEVTGILATHPNVVTPDFKLFIVVYRAKLVDPNQVLVPEEGEIAKLEWHSKAEFLNLNLIHNKYELILKPFLV